MSVQPNTTTGYCSPDDVARYFRTLQDGFDFDTNPTESEVNDFIMEASARVDRETGHAWRERQVVDEYHDLEGNYYYWAGTPISLMKREIRTPLDASKGDKLEFYDGNQWEEWVSDSQYDEGRNGDFWVNDVDGMLYIYMRSWWFERYKALRFSYRYGADQIPQDIQKATALYCAADLIRTDLYGDLLPAGGSDTPNPGTAADKLDEQADRILDRRREVRTF